MSGFISIAKVHGQDVQIAVAHIVQVRQETDTAVRVTTVDGQAFTLEGRTVADIMWLIQETEQ